ncbi:hypothetical protein Tco_0053968 [Tanacetum coccineum]
MLASSHYRNVSKQTTRTTIFRATLVLVVGGAGSGTATYSISNISEVLMSIDNVGYLRAMRHVSFEGEYLNRLEGLCIASLGP